MSSASPNSAGNARREKHWLRREFLKAACSIHTVRAVIVRVLAVLTQLYLMILKKCILGSSIHKILDPTRKRARLDV